MKITIDNVSSSSQINCILCHDKNGNVYLELNNVYYLLTISSNDEIEFYELNKFDEEDLEPRLNPHQITNVYNKKTLKEKALIKLEEDTKTDYSDDEETNISYFPENNFYKTNIEYDDECNEDLQFNISIYNDFKIFPQLNKSLDTFSLYDFLVMDDEHKQILKTLELSDENNYRITYLTKLNDFNLNIIGSMIKKFKIFYEEKDGNILIIVNNIEKKFMY